MFKTVLIANRGEIALRIARTLRAMDIRIIAVYADPDRTAPHVKFADLALRLPGNNAANTYLRIDLIIAAALESGADAIIPGYGFLSENPEFVEACELAGLTFIGPTSDQIRRFGLKHESREIAASVGLPLLPGTGLLDNLDEAIHGAEHLGYPVMLKSTAGGGGIGMTRCDSESELISAYDSVCRIAQVFFNNSGVFLERCIDHARHVEVQIFGDGKGNVVALGERDCSLQRRNQKIVEETPAPHLPESTREYLFTAAQALGRVVQYRSAGTVEFIYDKIREEVFFLEVNPRLQVEHPITEAVLGIDLVNWMVRTAAGVPPDLDRAPKSTGASVEVRIYAEDPVHDFRPSSGVLTEVVFPEDVRVDGWISRGAEISPYYDPLLAKIIVHGKNRKDALRLMSSALLQTRIGGIESNLEYLRTIIGSSVFISGEVSTEVLKHLTFSPNVIEVIDPGVFTTIQDYPGRVGLWSVGVPPSGPMDDYAFRIGNRIVGNNEKAAGLECTLRGPSLKFHRQTVIALTGAPANASVDGVPVPWWSAITLFSGQILNVGPNTSGCRSYISVRGGFDTPIYLGSRSTFVLGEFGGHCGRILRAGDLLPLGEFIKEDPGIADPSLIPGYTNDIEVKVLSGPHMSPDFFTEEYADILFCSGWKVHHDSNRLGIRLIGPVPVWARDNGGEAGLHPSNIHDTVYAIGSLNFTGDMPVILTCDGPSLGGFVCPLTIIKADLWKVGQAKPGDNIRFKPVSFEEASKLEVIQNKAISELRSRPANITSSNFFSIEKEALYRSVIHTLDREPGCPKVVYRQAGDRNLLLEYGSDDFDITDRFRIHALMKRLKASSSRGILELSPGVRSLQIRYDNKIIEQDKLLDLLVSLESELVDINKMRIDSRIIRLPLAFEDSTTLSAVERYKETIRSTAPWLPNNVDFIQRINGLNHRDEVKKTVFRANYIVLGLGDVYLGAPCALATDPRDRLLTSKYNPARTFTAEGAVGIGGVYMCIYGMNSPGGYQLVGRTLPIWSKFINNPAFVAEQPWLLRLFDQIRFYPVSEEELERMRADFRVGDKIIRIEETEFDLFRYLGFLEEQKESISQFRRKQQIAFHEEVAKWKFYQNYSESLSNKDLIDDADIQGLHVTANINGSIWKILVREGQYVEPAMPIVVLEAMKTEITIYSPVKGVVHTVVREERQVVSAGETILIIVSE